MTWLLVPKKMRTNPHENYPLLPIEAKENGGEFQARRGPEVFPCLGMWMKELGGIQRLEHLAEI
jgi:hypothetical protein